MGEGGGRGRRGGVEREFGRGEEWGKMGDFECKKGGNLDTVSNKQRMLPRLCFFNWVLMVRFGNLESIKREESNDVGYAPSPSAAHNRPTPLSARKRRKQRKRKKRKN